MSAGETSGPGTDKVLSREYLKSISKYEVVKIYRSIFEDSPHCHSDEPELWEAIYEDATFGRAVYEAILTGIPQKIDPTWD